VNEKERLSSSHHERCRNSLKEGIILEGERERDYNAGLKNNFALDFDFSLSLSASLQCTLYTLVSYPLSEISFFLQQQRPIILIPL
jgi:hypothetical protein